MRGQAATCTCTISGTWVRSVLLVSLLQADLCCARDEHVVFNLQCAYLARKQGWSRLLSGSRAIAASGGPSRAPTVV